MTTPDTRTLIWRTQRNAIAKHSGKLSRKLLLVTLTPRKLQQRDKHHPTIFNQARSILETTRHLGKLAPAFGEAKHFGESDPISGEEGMTTPDTCTQLQQFIQANEYATDPETVKAVKKAKRLLTLSYDEEQ